MLSRIPPIPVSVPLHHTHTLPARLHLQVPHSPFTTKDSLVRLNHLLHLIITPQEDPTPIVDMLGLNLHHARHLAVEGLAAGILEDHGHWLCVRALARHMICEVEEGKKGNAEPYDGGGVEAVRLTAHSYKILNFPFGDFLSAG